MDWTQLKNVPESTGANYSAGPGISIVGQTISNTGVLTVGANFPLSSSGGQNSIITLSGVVPVTRGGTGSATKNFVDLSTNQVIDGSKTFNKVIVDGGLTLSNKSQFIRYDPALIATLRWDQLLSSGDFATGNGPGAVAFDGANIWVANVRSNTVSKL